MRDTRAASGATPTAAVQVLSQFQCSRSIVSVSGVMECSSQSSSRAGVSLSQMLRAMLCALSQQLPSAREQERFCEEVVPALLEGLSDIHGMVTLDRRSIMHEIDMLVSLAWSLEAAVKDTSGKSDIRIVESHLHARGTCQGSLTGNSEVYLMGPDPAHAREARNTLRTLREKVQAWSSIVTCTTQLEEMWSDVLCCARDIEVVLEHRVQCVLLDADM